MDEIAHLPTAIIECVGPTFKTYEPLLRANATEIQATRFETFTYGNHPRQTLDVYYPTKKRRPSIVENNEPVLIFLHGGGLVRGSKRLEVADGLAYANVGHFFAEQLGYTTIIPDYRLIEHNARFPSGGEDLARVIDWVKETLTRKDGYSAVELFVIGNSAGGIHLSTYALSPDFETSRAKVMSMDPEAAVKLRGIVLLSVPFNFKKIVGMKEVLDAYYGDDHFVNSPQGLLKAAMLRDPDDVLPNVGVLLLTTSLDPKDEIIQPKEDFLNEWDDLDDTQAVTVNVIDGHNHVSSVLGLGTGIEKEEAWGHQVGEFLESLRE